MLKLISFEYVRLFPVKTLPGTFIQNDLFLRIEFKLRQKNSAGV